MQNGEFFGIQDRKLELGNVTMTATTYTHAKVEWHQHENAYFTFLLAGRMAEINRKGRLDCTPGTLLFHNAEEAHYNLKPKEYTRGFHLELGQDWITYFDGSIEPGSYPVLDPRRKLVMFELLREFLNFDGSQPAAAECLVNSLVQRSETTERQRVLVTPKWVALVRELLHDLPAHRWTLAELSKTADIHPNHLSRAFPNYFGCTLGQYIRTVRVERALTLMVSSTQSLSEISHRCGFSDQSHFNRTFRTVLRRTPLRYRKSLTWPPR